MEYFQEMHRFKGGAVTEKERGGECSRFHWSTSRTCTGTREEGGGLQKRKEEEPCNGADSIEVLPGHAQVQVGGEGYRKGKRRSLAM